MAYPNGVPPAPTSGPGEKGPPPWLRAQARPRRRAVAVSGRSPQRPTLQNIEPQQGIMAPTRTGPTHATERNKEHIVHPDPQRVNEEVTNATISTNMTCSEIIALLESHGCTDLTSRLDAKACSEYPVSNGGFGDVYSGRLENGTRVAIKTVRQYQSDGTSEGKYQKYAAKEIYAWSKCRHPNVARLMGIAKYRGRLAMISTWAENGTLPVYVNRNNSVDRGRLSASVCEGLAYLHGEGIVHGDLKGANVLVLGDGTPMLIDFGNTSIADPSMRFTTTASLASFSLRWTAPEILNASSPVSRPGDIYALGMTILETITGAVPYSDIATDPPVLFAVMINRQTPARPEDQPLLRSGSGDSLWGLLLSTWSHEPKLRPSAAEVRDFF